MNADQPPPFRRAWTTDGTARFRFEARSYTTPLFHSPGDSDPLQYSDQPRRPSLFRTAFSLLGAVHDLRREHARQQELDARVSSSDRRGAHRHEPSRSASGGDTRWEGREGGERPQHSRVNDAHGRREQGARRTRPSSRSHGSSRQEDAAAQCEPPIAQDDADEGANGRSRRRSRHVRSLETEVLFEQGEVDECSRWLAAHDNRDNTSERMLQHMKKQLQIHQRRLKDARTDLRAELARESAETSRSENIRRPPRRASTQDSSRRAMPQVPPAFDNLFSFLMGGAALGTSRTAPSSTLHADMFEQLFTEFAAQYPHATFSTSEGPPLGAGTIPRGFGSGYFDHGTPPASSFAQARTRSSRPSNLLSVQEAKALYKTYNDRWSVLAPSDPKLPYPGRNLQSAALVDRSTIWTPMVSSAVSTWSTEDVIRVNTQTFLLAAVDLVPTYTDRIAKIEMNFDHSKADAAQLQLLADMLKMEKMRWHSDRLGRRNGGKTGVNEALQQSEVTRGIFHAVCELSDLLSTKR